MIKIHEENIETGELSKQEQSKMNHLLVLEDFKRYSNLKDNEVKYYIIDEDA